MAMSDLELLQLVDTVKERQRGPQGEPGVGIDSVEQYDGQSFTLRLTDGSFKRIDLPKAADGATGAPGQPGPKGDVGPAGRDGSGGKDGLQGAPGLPGADGTTVETAIVSSAGNLLLGLSDGTIIDAGRVVGPAGATGSAGPTGLPGERGSDGAAVLSGPRAPQESDGIEGDHWIDISSAEFNFYKKGGSGWDKLASLRQPAQDRLVGAGAGSGGGAGGNGELQNTRTLPLINGGETIRKTAKNKGMPVPGVLLTQEDANQYFLGCLREQDVAVSDSVPRPPHQTGQLWFCTNPEDLTLYVYDGAVWVPAAPPVSLDGIEASIANVDAELLKVNANIAMNKRELDEAVLDVREDQERQDHQILELEEEIEALAPTFDRGEWAFVTEQPAAGQYAIGHLATSEYCLDIVGKCLIEAGDDEVAKSQCTRIAADCEAAEEKGEAYLSDSWGAVDTLKIHKLDAKGKEHGFGDWSVGKYVELFNHDDEGYGLFQIDKEAVIEADVATFKVHHVAHQGKPAGVARAKVFEMAAGDPTDYVRKSGDDMTGTLYIRPPKNSAGLRIYAPQGDAGAGQADATQLVRVANSHNQYVFYVEESGAIAGKNGDGADRRTGT